MENQRRKDCTALEDNKIVSRKSNEEIADDVADELKPDDMLVIDGHIASPKKFQKSSVSNKGVED